MLNQAIAAPLEEESGLGQRFHEINAKVHLIASEAVAKQYMKATVLLDRWSGLHYKSNSKQMKIGGETITMLQSPDPTASYREPAKAAFEELQKEFRKLVELMRSELKDDAVQI